MKNTKKQFAGESRKAESSPKRRKNAVWFGLHARTEWFVFLGIAVFLLASILIVDDYGMNIDSQKNFGEGEMNLNYILTGRVDQGVLQWQMHGAFIFIAAEAAKRILHDRFHLYDPTAARHIILPFLTAFFLGFLFYFVKRRWSAIQGFVVVGLLLTFPYFWGHRTCLF